jgi:hypothetical protein
MCSFNTQCLHRQLWERTSASRQSSGRASSWAGCTSQELVQQRVAVVSIFVCRAVAVELHSLHVLLGTAVLMQPHAAHPSVLNVTTSCHGHH